ncbi:cobalt ABC transporter [Bifidobacterium aemilianum]|uniref:Cobalt ABC transporter n=1 Tax=Bifidobacterium aemilianum TaxID=2493120 RepID=A0A366K853_9BIFI|nr:energy-coupling factor transporter transmembrane component T [Bifidobacterium aemilianum]RBP97915.1 cobalt ABC transporter [Bifidobacterium aemilianum]
MAKLCVADGSGNFLDRMNPLVKILGIFSFGLGALIWPDFSLGLVLLLVLFLLAAVAGILPSFSKLILGFGLPVSIMLLFIQGCYSPKNRVIIASWGFLHLGLEGTLYAAKIVSTLLVFLGAFYIVNKTTYTGRLVAALSGIGLPAKIGYLVLASLNVVPQMEHRIKVIRQAQSARGLETGGGLISRIKAYLPLLGPVVLSSLTDSQERGMTLETRGFGIKGVRQSSYVKVDWRKSDQLACWLLLVFFLLVLLASILSRTGIYPFTYDWGGGR